MTIGSIARWHQAARPEPTASDLRVQIGCHLEEVAEMLEALEPLTHDTDGLLFATLAGLQALSERLKSGSCDVVISNRAAALDAICDQIATAVGVAHCAGMRIEDALAEVDRANWSKFVDGQSLRDANGKIIKGPNYTPPNLEGLF